MKAVGSVLPEHMNPKRRMTSPSRDTPTTVNPITAPPETAMLRAPFIPCFWAAYAVLAFALVAIVMPMTPAVADIIEPHTKETADLQPKYFPVRSMAIAMTATTMKM